MRERGSTWIYMRWKSRKLASSQRVKCEQWHWCVDENVWWQGQGKVTCGARRWELTLDQKDDQIPSSHRASPRNPCFPGRGFSFFILEVYGLMGPVSEKVAQVSWWKVGGRGKARPPSGCWDDPGKEWPAAAEATGRRGGSASRAIARKRGPWTVACGCNNDGLGCS